MQNFSPHLRKLSTVHMTLSPIWLDKLGFAIILNFAEQNCCCATTFLLIYQIFSLSRQKSAAAIN